MKFGKSFEETIKNKFPEDWRNAAIQYKELKRCIKKVVGELAGLGLNSSTLHLLVAAPHDPTSAQTNEDGFSHLQYGFEGDAKSFKPKILLTIDDDLIISGYVSPETKTALQRLMDHPELFRTHSKIVDVTDDEKAASEQADVAPPPVTNTSHLPTTEADAVEEVNIVETDRDMARSDNQGEAIALEETKTDEGKEIHLGADHRPRTIQITLEADSEFFHLLTEEMASIDKLQETQKKRLISEVSNLGKELQVVTKPTGYAKKSDDLYKWREIFELYRDASIFYATTEREHGGRTAAQADKHLKWFAAQLQSRNLRFKHKKSNDLLNLFLDINKTIWISMYFREMNATATEKILKKFDKRTALTARSSFPEFMASDPFFSESLAKSVNYVIAENLLTVLPQLDDYTCPVCASITFKPIRLSCGHVFCIRCLIKLQRQKTSNCPICRRDVVMEADSSNLDENLLKFLQLYFPKEVKAKQLENEKALGLDQLEKVGFGKTEGKECIIM